MENFLEIFDILYNMMCCSIYNLNMFIKSTFYYNYSNCRNTDVYDEEEVCGKVYNGEYGESESGESDCGESECGDGESESECEGESESECEGESESECGDGESESECEGESGSGSGSESDCELGSESDCDGESDCESGGSGSESGESGSESGSGSEEDGKNFSKMWYCKVCEYYNPVSTIQCISCSVVKENDTWDIIDFQDFTYIENKIENK